MTTIGVSRCALVCAVVTTCLGLGIDETCAQTAIDTLSCPERMADRRVDDEWRLLGPAAPQQGAAVGETGNAAAYVPPTTGDRLKWALDGTLGSGSVAAAVFIASWNTAWNVPSEWGASWPGFGKRLAAREGQGAISNGIEAGLGATWGEDPRYFRSARGGSWARTGHAAKAVFVAHGRNGQLHPAWARYVGAIGSDVVANTWLPASDRTALDSLRRIGNGFLGRFVGNLWMEFWPDVRRRIAKRD
jgi:hypothetical protein